MTINQDKEDLDRAIKLLQEALDRIQYEYIRGFGEIEDKIEKFLKEIKENDSRESKN